MSGTNENRYVWVREWRWPFHADDQPSRSYDIYSLEPKAGVSEEDIERFVTEELFPAVGEIVTRAGSVVRHYLLKRHVRRDGAVEDSLSWIFAGREIDESVQAKFESLATSEGSNSFDLAGIWESDLVGVWESKKSGE